MDTFVDSALEISNVDENELKLRNVIKKGVAECDLAIIGLPFDGATFGRQGAKYGPKFLREALYNFNTYSYTFRIDLKDLVINDYGDLLISNSDLNFSYSKIREAAIEAYKKAKMVAFLGGDHSITYATASALAELGSVSLIVMDAHHDVRRLKKNFSSSGTYLRTLIEEKKNIKNVFQLGIRDFYNSTSYVEYVEHSNVKYYTIEEIRNRSIEKVCEEIINSASQTDFTYMSLDMDVLDACYSKGVNSLCVNGMEPKEIISLTRKLGRIKNMKGIDVVEIAPLYENDKISCHLGAYLILSAVSSHFSL
ncbi:MAG TPA: agmatinase family protein [Geobacterales bacterium]|nr:agmatinase family protein [Geobacterales bacterium]